MVQNWFISHKTYRNFRLDVQDFRKTAFMAQTIRLDSSTHKRDAGKNVGIPFELFCPSAYADKYL